MDINQMAKDHANENTVSRFWNDEEMTQHMVETFLAGFEAKEAELKNQLHDNLDKVHTAKITKPENDERILKGEFNYEKGDLCFICHTQNVSFMEVLEALTALRNELTRQIDNQKQCPFHDVSAKI